MHQIKTDLRKRYPSILDNVVEWDCSFSDAIKRLNAEAIDVLKKKGTLEGWQ